MIKNFKVYKHTSPSGKVYIGITQQKTTKRWENGNGYKNNKYFVNAIKKYGWNNFKHEILFENLTEEEAKLLEQMYIALYDSSNRKKGYNRTLGGDGVRGYYHSAETKEKLSKISKTLWENPSYRQHMSEIHKGQFSGENHPMYGVRGELSYFYGKHHSEKTRKKISDSLKGHEVKMETREKISKKNKGKISSRKGKKQESTSGAKHPQSTQVICITTGETFDYIKQAENKYNAFNIGACCKGKRKSAGTLPNGTPLKWMYYEDYLKEYMEKHC